MFVFLMISGFAVDLGRYMAKVQKTQQMADSLALAGAGWFNQPRPVDEVDTRAILSLTLEKLNSYSGQDTALYEIDPEMKTGAIQLKKFPADDVHPDTYFRFGVNVMQGFSPYFFPNWLLSRDSFLIQRRAVAEIVPRFTGFNYYPTAGEEIPVPPLQYSIYAKSNIKPEQMDCFIVDGDLHADNGWVVLENITGNTCGDGVQISGNVEAGDPAAAGSSCGGATPDPGCVRLQNITGHIDGRAIWPTGYVNDGSVGPAGGNVNADPGLYDLTIPPTPDEDPDQYNQPICTIDAGGAEYTIGDFGAMGACSDEGTIYVRNGDLKISGANTQGDYTFVSDGNVKFESVDDLDSHDMFVYSINGGIKFENVVGAEINATLYAPDPAQGEIKWETSENVTINGGIISGRDALIQTSGRVAINYKNNATLMPQSLRTREYLNNIPDYYLIRLIH
jgi:hypothetical protein